MVRTVDFIQSLFRRYRVVDMARMQKACEGRSRRSIFRDLVRFDYISSFTHAGRYYTLMDIAMFEHGLWFHQGVGFSQDGTLRRTVVRLVEQSEAGMMHDELRRLLRVRVHNTLLKVVREGLLGREQVERWYVYVSTDAVRAAEQVEARRALLVRAQQASPLLPGLVIEVLVEVIAAGGIVVEPRVAVAGLAARGIAVSVEQVVRVYREHGLVPGKKTP